MNKWIPLFLAIITLAENLTNDLYLPSLPHLTSVFNTSEDIIRFTLTAFFLGVLIPQLLLGALADIWGHRQVLLCGSICFILASILCSLSSTISVFISVRFLQGVGVCCVNITSYSILRDLYDYKNATRFIAYLMMAGTFSPLLGPIVGGYVLLWFSWRYNFLIVVLLSLISVIGLWLSVPKIQPLVKHKNVIKKIPYDYLSLLHDRDFLSYTIIYSALSAGVIAYLTDAPFIIIQKFNVLPEHYGYTQIFIFGPYILGCLLTSYATKYFDIKKWMISGVILAGISSSALLWINIIYQESLITLIVPMMGYELGFSLAISPLIMYLSSLYPDKKGIVLALAGFISTACSALASLSISFFHSIRLTTLGTLISGMVLISIIIFFSLRKGRLFTG